MDESKKDEASTSEDTEKMKEEEKDRKQFEKDVEDMFKLFDKNKDKSITTDEMGKVLRALGFQLSKKEIKIAMNQIDTNKNGKVEFGEFRTFMMKEWKKARANPDPEKEIRQAFKLFDRDGNGFIEKKELRIAMKSLGEALTEAELDLMMKDADLNQDGKIDYSEFVRMWMQKSKETT